MRDVEFKELEKKFRDGYLSGMQDMYMYLVQAERYTFDNKEQSSLKSDDEKHTIKRMQSLISKVNQWANFGNFAHQELPPGHWQIVD